MTANTESQPATSRRALLAGILGGLGALGASAMGGVSPTRAANDDPVTVGNSFSGTVVTKITNSDPGEIAIWGNASAGTSTGVGVYGDSASPFGVGVSGFANGSGVQGVSTTGTGVRGFSPIVAVSGESDVGIGLLCSSEATDHAAGVGQSFGESTGILGYSGSNPLPTPPPRTGVCGYANQDGTAVGVAGDSAIGTGIQGATSTGIGVVGFATTSSGANAVGVYGRSASSAGVGVAARSSGNATAVLAISGTGTFPAAKAKTAIYGIATQDSLARGVWGETTSGHAIHGTATTGWAGYFSGKVYTSKYHEMSEITPPAAPSANNARLFVRDNGSGKTQLCVRFNTGGVLVIKTQP